MLRPFYETVRVYETVREGTPSVSDPRHGFNPISMTRRCASWPGAGGDKFTLIRPEVSRRLS